jgi:hypothetical protein
MGGNVFVELIEFLLGGRARKRQPAGCLFLLR